MNVEQAHALFQKEKTALLRPTSHPLPSRPGELEVMEAEGAEGVVDVVAVVAADEEVVEVQGDNHSEFKKQFRPPVH